MSALAQSVGSYERAFGILERRRIQRYLRN